MKRLMVWTGPVSSAKSTAALGMAHRFQTMGLCVILVRPTCSVREHEECGEFKTKNGMPWLSFEVDMPWQILTKVLEGAGVVWIDELLCSRATTWTFSTRSTRFARIAS